MAGRESRNAEDLLSAVVGVAALASAAAMLAMRHWRVDPDAPQLGLVGAWSAIMEDAGLDAWGGLQPALVALTALIAAGIGLALSIRPSALASVRRLRRAMLSGTVAVLWFFQLRLLLEAPPAGIALLDVAAHALGAWALAELAAFLVSYPRVPDETVLRRFVQDQFSFRDAATASPPPTTWWPLTLRRQLYDRVGAALQRAGWRKGAAADVAERRVEQAVAQSAKQVRALAGTGAARVWTALGVVAGSCFVLGERIPALEGVALALAGFGMFLPVFAIESLRVNYVYGSDEERRRIGAIYLGPVAGFLIGLTAVAGSTLWFLATAEPAGAFRDPAHVAFSISVLLFFTTITAGVVVGLAIAIFHRGSFDPRLAIRRGAVVTFSGLLVTALFVAVEGAVSSQIVLRSGLPAQSGPVIAGTLAALLFAPVRRRVDGVVGRAVDRWMPAAAIAEGDVAAVSVCFVDLCGYTALSATDQSLALLHAGLLHKCARAAAADGDGRLVKTIGDAAMLRLPTPQAAVDCVRRIADDYRRGAVALDIVALPLHAGVHHGDALVARDGDLFGTTVNLAARLLDAAGEHQLLLSDTVRVALAATPVQPRGALTLRNVPGTVESFVVPLAG